MREYVFGWIARGTGAVGGRALVAIKESHRGSVSAVSRAGLELTVVEIAVLRRLSPMEAMRECWWWKERLRSLKRCLVNKIPWGSIHFNVIAVKSVHFTVASSPSSTPRFGKVRASSASRSHVRQLSIQARASKRSSRVRVKSGSGKANAGDISRSRTTTTSTSK